MVGRVGDTGFVQIMAETFDKLTPKQRLDAYWLTMAAIAVNPIAFDQNSSDGIAEKHLLEAILTHPEGIDPAVLKKITEFAMLFWGNQGNHNSFTYKKFLPDFTADELRAAALQAAKNGARLGTPVALDKELNQLQKPLFDPNFQPMSIVKNPPAGQDPLQAGLTNSYSGVTLKDLVGSRRAMP